MVTVAGSAFACGLILCVLLVGTASSQSATAAPGSSNVSLCNTTNNGTVGANATTGNCTNSSTPTTVPPTTTTPPPTTTAAPTPAPPTLSPCEAARFACDDTLSRCVRGSAFNRCGCLARYWRCLTDTACGGPTEADEELCADRASGLRCGTYDDVDTGWRVCPEDAGVVYDDTASGWIVALVFVSTALLLLLASLGYIGAVRGWYRDSDGRLMLNGKTPVEDKAKAIAGAYFPGTAMGRAFNAERRRDERRRRKAQLKAQRGANASSDGSSDSEDRRRRANPASVSAAAGLPAGAEPPEVVVMTPDAVERYKNYLRDRYDADEAQRRERRRQRHGRADDEARRGSSSSSEGSDYDRRPALIRTPPRARPAAGSPHDVSVGGVSLVRPASREHREFEKRYEAEMAALRAGASPASHDSLAQVALEIDVAEREIARGRSRLAEMLAVEREGMVRELSVGREASREGLPGDSFRDSYADTMGPGGRFSIRAPDGGDRHGGFGVGGNGDGGNPISLLFDGGGAEPGRRGVGSAAGSGGLRLATAANPPDVVALGRDASRSPLSQRHLDRLPGHGGGAPPTLTMEQLTRLDSSAFAPGHRNPLEQGPGQQSLLQQPRAAAGSPHGNGGGTHPLIMFARGASPTPSL